MNACGIHSNDEDEDGGRKDRSPVNGTVQDEGYRWVWVENTDTYRLYQAMERSRSIDASPEGRNGESRV